MSDFATIYMDYAATTPLDPRVAAVMRPLWEEMTGNSSSLQNPHGHKAKKIIEEARATVAASVGALPEEIIFTSGATEANNIALFGISEFLKQRKKQHIVTSRTEHASILMPLRQMMKDNFDVSFCRLLPCGSADGPFILEKITPQTGLISVQAVNNETGVINPLDEVRDGIAGTDILFHTDATQMLGKVAVDMKKMDVHMATLSAHKAYGPQGIGALYICKDIQSHIMPLLYGGGQQSAIRPGTLPVALIAGFSEACKLARIEQAQEKERLEELNCLFRKILNDANITYKINVHDYGEDSRTWRVPGIMNIHFQGIESEWLLEAINDVSFSTGSACSARGNHSSHVLEAMGLNAQQSAESIRLSFGRFTSEEDIKHVAQSFLTAIQGINALANIAYKEAL